jgi:hypothetical protein
MSSGRKTGIHSFGPRHGIRSLKVDQAKTAAKWETPPRCVMAKGIIRPVAADNEANGNDEKKQEEEEEEDAKVAKDAKDAKDGDERRGTKKERKTGLHGLSSKGHAKKLRDTPYGDKPGPRMICVGGNSLLATSTTEDGLVKWICSTCTFANTGGQGMRVCQMCGERRMTKKQEVAMRFKKPSKG